MSVLNYDGPKGALAPESKFNMWINKKKFYK